MHEGADLDDVQAGGDELFDPVELLRCRHDTLLDLQPVAHASFVKDDLRHVSTPRDYVRVRPAFRAVRFRILNAAPAAPTPLSILTTDTPGAQPVSMPSSAVKPPSAAP